MWRSGELDVNRAAREIGDFLMSGETASGKRTGPPIPPWYSALTSQFLPEPLRAGYDLPFGARERQAAERALRWIRWVNPRPPRLPERVCYVPPYLEALGQIEGRSGPGFLTQGLNTLWVGRAQLVS